MESFGQFRFAVLGNARAWRDGVELDLGPARQRCVFAVLLLGGGRAVTRTQLIDAVWGDAAPRTAPAAVHVYISRLRRVLTQDPAVARRALVHSRAGYLLGVDGVSDAGAFGALVATARQARSRGDLSGAVATFADALQLWGGPPLSGLSGPFVEVE
ncbi:MAG TPA: winged helix-turn-helix domain-containing protein, partial [Micromonosporaceae bacterium]|nr:winged helix-turn-helix domain-containing protein [Micromonosporaceae bacterium]